MKALRLICCAAVLGAAVGPVASAQDASALKTTMLTFSGPVALPGVTLPAGTYRFQIADADSSRRVIVVHNQDGTKPFGMFLTIPNQLIEPAEKPVVMFSEAPAGSATPVKAWFYPGERTGYEFVYPKEQAVRIAKATHQSVLTAENASDNTAEAIKRRNIGRVDENGNQVDEHNNRIAAASTSSNRSTTDRAQNNTAPAPAASTTAAPASTSSARATTTPSNTAGTSGQAATNTAGDQTKRRARTLPRTASTLGLFELLSGLSLAGALGVNQLRKRFTHEM